MPTKPVLPITELDFFRGKNQLKEFLRNDTSGRFSDIDFEGSNISVLLEVLAYNTYQNNFYTNMAISEMFLDSAQLENSVVSHAKELNYLPRSARSAKAVVTLNIIDNNSNAATVSIPRNTRFSTSQAGSRFNFYTDQHYVARRVGNTFIAENVEIFEGELVQEDFSIVNDNKTFRLTNQDIDISSIRVIENFNNPSESVEYLYSKDIFGIGPDDAVFYLEPSFDQTYEIVFGNNRFGRTPAKNAGVRVFYRVANGSAANGACKFTTAIQNLGNGISVITTSNADSGTEKETLEDIKFFAPKSIQVQERAVTQRDYEVLLKQRFNEIQDVSVFGGDELDPPQFGKVAISVNLDGGLTETLQARYISFLKDKTPVGIQPVILPPRFMSLNAVIEVIFSPRLTGKSKQQIESEIRELLQEYSRTELGKFGSVFEISRVSALIDNLDISIQNNTIDTSPYILYSPEFNRVENPTFDFGSALESPCGFARAEGTQTFNRFVRSSRFIFNGTESIFEDNGLGKINIINARDRDRGVFDFIRLNAGTVNYETGVVKLSDFIVDSYEGRGIQISANTREKNVTAPKTKVLSLSDTDITINIREASGEILAGPRPVSSTGTVITPGGTTTGSGGSSFGGY